MLTYPRQHSRPQLLLAVSAALLLPASGRAAIEPDQFSASVSSRLVLVPVTVTDRNGKSISGLAREHFQVTEDSQPQTIVSLSREDGAIGLGIVLDLSGSMQHKIGPAVAAARAFAALAGEEDEVFLLTFADAPEMRVPLTRSREAIGRWLTGAQANGSTALIDATYRALHEVRRSSHRRKALVVISDGGDNASRYSDAELRQRAIESDTQIYSISIAEGAANRDAWRAAHLLKELAETTGGLHFTIRDHRSLPEVAEKLARAMKEIYVIGYKPAEASPGKWRRLRVSLTLSPSRDVRVTARSGYYFPE